LINDGEATGSGKDGIGDDTRWLCKVGRGDEDLHAIGVAVELGRDGARVDDDDINAKGLDLGADGRGKGREERLGRGVERGERVRDEAGRGRRERDQPLLLLVHHLVQKVVRDLDGRGCVDLKVAHVS